MCHQRRGSRRGGRTDRLVATRSCQVPCGERALSGGSLLAKGKADGRKVGAWGPVGLDITGGSQDVRTSCGVRRRLTVERPIGTAIPLPLARDRRRDEAAVARPAGFYADRHWQPVGGVSMTPAVNRCRRLLCGCTALAGSIAQRGRGMLAEENRGEHHGGHAGGNKFHSPITIADHFQSSRRRTRSGLLGCAPPDAKEERRAHR